MTNSSCPLSLLEMLAIENDRVSSVPGIGDVDVLAGEELDLRGLDQLEDQVPHVVGDGSLETTSATASWIGWPERIISSS